MRFYFSLLTIDVFFLKICTRLSQKLNLTRYLNNFSHDIIINIATSLCLLSALFATVINISC